MKVPEFKRILKDHIPSNIQRKDYILLFAGCAPCQPFSKLKKTDFHAKEGKLLLKFSFLVRKMNPDLIFSENVPQIKHHSVFTRFQKEIKSAGYHKAYDLVDFKNYGVPQMRKRLVFFGAKSFHPQIPRPSIKIKTVRDTISHLPKLKIGETCQKDLNHVAAKLSRKNIKRLKYTPKNGGSHSSWPEHLHLPCHRKFGYYKDVYGRMYWNKPAPTLTTRCISFSNGRYGHPEQNRAISIREAALLQTYSKSYRFFGSNTVIAKHIGNSVPPKGAKIFGKSLIKQVSQ